MRSLAISFALATFVIAAVSYTSAQAPACPNSQNIQQVAAQAALAASSSQEVQSPSEKDSLNEIKLANLRARKSELQHQIKEQDSKRDRQIAGVAPETLEAMNNYQDSVCLALRSELVEVNLQINELAPTQVSQQVLNRFHHIVNSQATDSTAAQPAKPADVTPEVLPAPAKPAKK